MNLFKNNKAFTMIELVIVMLIILVLAVAGFAMYSGNVDAARDKMAKGLHTQLQSYVDNYAMQNVAITSGPGAGSKSFPNATYNSPNWEFVAGNCFHDDGGTTGIAGNGIQDGDEADVIAGDCSPAVMPTNSSECLSCDVGGDDTEWTGIGVGDDVAWMETLRECDVFWNDLSVAIAPEIAIDLHSNGIDNTQPDYLITYQLGDPSSTTYEVGTLSDPAPQTYP